MTTTGYPTPPSIFALGNELLTSFTLVFGHPLKSEICVNSYNIKIEQDGLEFFNNSISRTQLHQGAMIDLAEIIEAPVFTCRYQYTFQITTDYGAISSKKVIGNPNFKGNCLKIGQYSCKSIAVYEPQKIIGHLTT